MSELTLIRLCTVYVVEVARVRFGAPGHLVLMAYAVFYQILTSVNLLVGASSVYTAMTGVNPYACCVLFPLGVVVYTLFGGIKATFLTGGPSAVVEVIELTNVG